MLMCEEATVQSQGDNNTLYPVKILVPRKPWGMTNVGNFSLTQG